MLKRFFRYYRPYRSLFILDFTCAVFAGLLELAFPVAVNQVIDKIMPQNNFRLILLACLGLFLFYVINITIFLRNFRQLFFAFIFICHHLITV